MTDRSRYRDMTDDDLERLIRDLPTRQPTAALRHRILSHVDQRNSRRPALSRPAFAFAALIVLLVADLLALSLQDAGLGLKRAPAALIRAQPSPAEDQYLAWLHEIGRSGLTQRIALLRAQEERSRYTYSALRRSLLDNAEGG